MKTSVVVPGFREVIHIRNLIFRATEHTSTQISFIITCTYFYGYKTRFFFLLKQSEKNLDPFLNRPRLLGLFLKGKIHHN